MGEIDEDFPRNSVLRSGKEVGGGGGGGRGGVGGEGGGGGADFG